MKKLLTIIVLILLTAAVSSASAQNDVRVKCGNFTMNVLSDNTRCYQTKENIPVPEDAEPQALASAQIANTTIFLSDLESFGSGIEPQVTFYLLDDLMKTSFTLLNPVMNLRDLLENIRGGYTTLDSVTTPVPLLPMQVKEQTAAALPQIIDFESGSGLRTVVAYSDPISSGMGSTELYYSWQGVSTDNNYYISAIFPLVNNNLNGKPVSAADWQNIPASDFQPSLDQLDYFVRSIVIE